VARPTIPEEERRQKIEVVRVTPEEQDQFSAAVKILGGNKSVHLHLHIIHLIEKAKEKNPEKFERLFQYYSKQRKAEGRDRPAKKVSKSPAKKK
jgi:hypothetical protein